MVNEWDPVFETDWGPLLSAEFGQPYWASLWSRIDLEPRSRVFPPPGDVFRALLLTSHANTKVVIVGQDPYPTAGQAHGLSFSVRCGVPVPRSLRIIYRELQEGLGVHPPDHGNLEAWAREGVLLLNATLTVREGEAGSHEGWGWETFTDQVVRVVDSKPDRVVFMLWGEKAQRKGALIDKFKHVVICSSHPAPQAAFRSPNPFFWSEPFRRANRALVAKGVDEIVWTLPDCTGLG